MFDWNEKKERKKTRREKTEKKIERILISLSGWRGKKLLIWVLNWLKYLLVWLIENLWWDVGWKVDNFVRKILRFSWKIHEIFVDILKAKLLLSTKIQTISSAISPLSYDFFLRNKPSNLLHFHRQPAFVYVEVTRRRTFIYNRQRLWLIDFQFVTYEMKKRRKKCYW